MTYRLFTRLINGQQYIPESVCNMNRRNDLRKLFESCLIFSRFRPDLLSPNMPRSLKQRIPNNIQLEIDFNELHNYVRHPELFKLNS